MTDPLNEILEYLRKYMVTEARITKIMRLMLDESNQAVKRGRQQIIQELEDIRQDYENNRQQMRQTTISAALYRIERKKWI